MRFIAIIADSWEQFVTNNVNHGFYFNVSLGTGTREDRPRTCIVYINAHDVAFTREKSQGIVYDSMRNISNTAEDEVVDCVRRRTRQYARRAA